MRSMVAGRAELSRSLFVARCRDVIGMERDWCGAWWLGGLSSRGVNVRFACGTVVWPVVQRGAWPETGPECLEGC